MIAALGEKPKSLVDYIRTDAILEHLRHFESIAKANGGNRAVGPGHAATAEYVISKLKKHTTCEPYIRKFKAPIWSELSPLAVNVTHPWTDTLIPGIDVRVMRYGGRSANIPSTPLQHIYQDVCNPDTYQGFPTGKIALILRNATCEPYIIAQQAQDAGASAVVLYNPPDVRYLSNARVRIVEWKEGDPLIDIPVLSMTHSVGVALASAKESSLSIATNTSLEVLETFNVICDTKKGDHDNVIVVGAHLDGVPAGPGIVDNGSGSATLLEIALQLYKSRLTRKIKNRIRFAWWGAEEVGLLGSRHYVRELQSSKKGRKELGKIVANLNYDMVASPNGRVGIHDGATAPPPIRNASLHLTHLLSQYHNATFPKQHHALSPMYAGSDFLPFLLAGIPSGGLDSGAGGIKTAEERHLFGGVAGVPFDGCYHQACDTVENVSVELLRVMSKVAAFGVERVAGMEGVREWLGRGGGEGV
ncbi:hypothetical protein HDV00_004513 [Rhizophlyctis rosea]|nr:hypothetical protein HDV00_004513 [Rhizophlyctis rosea]